MNVKPKLWLLDMDGTLTHNGEGTGFYGQIIDGITDFLDALDAKGIPWAVVTNSDTELATWNLRMAGLDRRPHAILGDGFEGCAPKPAHDLLSRACSLLGYDTGSAIMVGDHFYDLKAAYKAGMPSILAQWSGALPARNTGEWMPVMTATHPSQLIELLDEGFPEPAWMEMRRGDKDRDAG